MEKYTAETSFLNFEEFNEELEPFILQINQFADEVGTQWPPDWDYHNFEEHGLETFSEFLNLVRYARANGVDVSTKVLVAGILSSLEHDILLHWGDPSMSRSVEERSSNFGTNAAKNAGFDLEIILLKNKGTLATRPGSECKELIEILMRRADIANFAWDYDPFKLKTVKVWREDQKNALLKGKPIKSFKEWVLDEKRCGFVNDCLLDQDLILGEFDKGLNGKSIFHDEAYPNIEKLFEEVTSQDYIEPELHEAA